MKKVNLLSRAEMRNVMGGNPPGPCLAECKKDGDACEKDSVAGRCTFYAATPDCTDGEFACIVTES